MYIWMQTHSDTDMFWDLSFQSISHFRTATHSPLHIPLFTLLELFSMSERQKRIWKWPWGGEELTSLLISVISGTSNYLSHYLSYNKFQRYTYNWITACLRSENGGQVSLHNSALYAPLGVHVITLWRHFTQKKTIRKQYAIYHLHLRRMA